MSHKADKREVDTALKNLEVRLQEELANIINEEMVGKASVDDLQYFRKEINFKVDKPELDAFRQDFVDRIA